MGGNSPLALGGSMTKREEMTNDEGRIELDVKEV